MTDKEVEIYLKFGFTDQMLHQSTFFEPVGCDKCTQGWKGRAAIHEALYFSREILDMTRITIAETGAEGSGARFELSVPKGAYRPVK